jgi:hypothetical protein
MHNRGNDVEEQPQTNKWRYGVTYAAYAVTKMQTSKWR